MSMVHRFRFSSILLALISGMALLLPASSVQAASSRAPLQAAGSGHVTVMVLDMSGSMAQNDPNGLRCSAANAYIDLTRPGDAIGLIGLDNNDGKTGGPHGFQTAQVWSQPITVNVDSDKAKIRGVISQQSHNCRPDSNTPTYDALAQAAAMLTNATQGGKLSGSVILLTDGIPAPNDSDQVSAILNDLVPTFRNKNWPVDTIALGTDTSFHGFLTQLAGGTGGKFYDDNNGPVSGASTLNLEPFFVDIFKLRNGRAPGPSIPPTDLGGGKQFNFTVGNFVQTIDVIAVKDSPDAKITITAPDGRSFDSGTAGIFAATDPHYAIFTIDAPQAGTWQLNATGNGLFLMDSLTVSKLDLAITSPTAGKAQPLGTDITITASVRDGGNIVVGKYALKATVSFAGDKGNFQPREVLLTGDNSGNYSGILNIPTSATPGSYQIIVEAKAASETAATAQIIAPFALFPKPVLIDQKTQQPTDLLNANVLRWDPGLRFVYSLPVLGWSYLGWHPSDLPLQGLSANSEALAHGRVVIGTVPYPNATVTASATTKDGKPVSQVAVSNDGNGQFRIYLPAASAGTYLVTMNAKGQFKDSFGQLQTNTATIAVTIGAPSLADEVRAWAITLLYLLLIVFFTLFFIYGPINYLVRPKPDGTAVLIEPNPRAVRRYQQDPGTPLRWRGWSLRRYFSPNRLPGSQVFLNGIDFLFRRGNTVDISVPQSKTAPVVTVDGKTIDPGQSATLFTNSRIAIGSGVEKREYKFEQAVKGGIDPNTGAFGSSSNLRDKIEDRLPGRRGVRRD